mmetsp:Transcript_17109/g.15073  ORF Transcript_17109/g.15073 Transcript_17109/m.15073 type:complete len:298 (+) Transcript_17109:9-902(+)
MREKISEPENINLDQERAPKSNKLRSRECRERKKKYITVLEAKIKSLEEENLRLSGENSLLTTQNESSVKTDETPIIHREYPPTFEHPLLEYEDFVYDKLSKLIRKDPDEVRYSTLEQANEHITDFSDDRVDYLKTAFKSIIENVVNLETKCYQTCHKNLHVSEWLKRNKCKKRHTKYIEKEVQTPEEMYLDYRFSEGIHEFVRKDGRKMTCYRKRIQKLVQKLVQVRNQIFNVYSEMKITVENSTSAKSYNKSDVGNMCELMDRLKEGDFLNPHYVWNIPKKNHTKEFYEDGELTE